MEEILYKYNPWWEENYSAPGIERKKYLDVLEKQATKNKITFIIGLRRVGKTTLIRQFIEKLLQTVESKKILFVSMEHPGFTDKSILSIVEEFRKINMLSRKDKIYLFFDEVHLKEGFERDLKVLFDSENVHIFASGSSASLLKDKKAFLTGRHIDVIVEPLDFKEFLEFNNLNVKKSEQYLYSKYFFDYMEYGGMPEYVLTKDSEAITHLVSDIIYKDIIAKYGIKNTKEINELFKLLCERSGKRLTYNKLANVLSISVDTVKTYISYFEEAFLTYLIEKHEKSLNARIKAPKKIYLADIGIRNVFSGFKDKGAIFENLVFLKIKDKNPRYYFENGKEIDFIFDDTAIESKFKKVNEDDLKALNESKFKNKIVASDWKFFTS